MARRVRKSLIAAFVLLHLTAISWWLIPAGGYPRDERTVDLPALSGLEKRLFDWKKAHGSALPFRWLDDYAVLSGTRQYWSMFAPNPPEVHDWLTVLAVIDWERPGPDTPLPPVEPPWGKDRTPVTDPVPLYRSYEGDLARRMGGSAGFYRDDPKLAENLSSGDWNGPLESFGRYWAGRYRELGGKMPLGIIIMDRVGRLPRPYSGVLPSAVVPVQRVLWYGAD